MNTEANNLKTEQSETYSLLDSILGNTKLLASFSIVCAFILGITFISTIETIEQIQRETESKALADIIAGVSYDNDLTHSVIALTPTQLNELNLHKPTNYYFAMHQGQVKAIILPAIATDGYSGNIRILIGIDSDEIITGVRVTEHKETPGLGDKVDLNKSDWVLTFNGKGFSNLTQSQWQVKKNGGHFDAFTGATITPMAVVKRVTNTLIFYQKHKHKLISKAQQHLLAKP